MNHLSYLCIIIINSVIIYLFLLQYFDYPESFKLNPLYEPTIECNIKSKCPKIIHQIVPDMNNVPSGLYNTIMYHIKLNPEFEYRIYDYNSILDILKKDFDESNIYAYNASDLYQIKTDYIKLAFIEKYGGFFIDIKNILCCKLTELLKINSIYYVHNLSNNTIDFSLLASQPNNPAIQNALKYATNNLINNEYGIDYLEITSGRVLGNELFYLGYLAEFSLLVLDSNNNINFRNKANKKLVSKIYKSFDKENITHSILPDIKLDWNEKLIYTNKI